MCGAHEACVTLIPDIRAMNRGHHRRSTPRAILIAGPTASGKSALALSIAGMFRGTIINADSMQVYRDLHVITARPTPDEEASVPHRLYGHVDAAGNYSVGRWLTDGQAALAQAARDDRLAVVVGGPGLYFKALTQGLTAVPPIPAGVRAAARARLATEGARALHAELVSPDAESAARVRPADGVRIVRALEVLEATGRALSDWHRDGMEPAVDPQRAVRIFLDVPRDELYRRIDQRFDRMVAAGAPRAGRAPPARGVGPLPPAQKAPGGAWR